SGSVVERYVCGPYGKQKVLDSSWTTRSASSYSFIYGFQGLRLQLPSGLYYGRYRDLSPTLGRWLELDPMLSSLHISNLYVGYSDAPTNRLESLSLDDKLSLKVVQKPTRTKFPREETLQAYPQLKKDLDFYDKKGTGFAFKTQWIVNDCKEGW